MRHGGCGDHRASDTEPSSRGRQLAWPRTGPNETAASILCLELAQQPDVSTPELRVDRESVHEVCPSCPALIAIPQQASGDRIPVGLVLDEDFTEMLASRRAQRAEQVTEV